MTNSKRAFSLPELMLVLALFSLTSLLLFMLLRDGFRQFRVTSARTSIQKRMSTALNWLQKDLEKADPAQIAIKRVPTPGNGDAIWFLSPDDPTQTNPDLRFIRDPASGSPRWQRHILYYLIRPGDYAKISGGYNCAIDPDPLADYYAPHKFLIRKVINRPEDPEKLMTANEIDTFLTTPVDQRLANLMTEPQVDRRKLVSDGLLSFIVRRYDRTVEIDLQAVQLERANTSVHVGGLSLKDHPFTEVQRLRVVMKQ